ncbi:hypothetical protein [Nocardiopsis ansamitocini]|nr:hypothetical protein [Nocardiopsis ansamitocini]
MNEDGTVTDFGNTGAQMRRCSVNAAELPRRFGASLDAVVEEVALE